jgi:methylated-DNA-protein-cysteine methyltransferase-like protein
MNFREAVYTLINAIPPGRVMTYGQIAAILGYPRAARAVGGAMAVVPDPMSTPWWRVINQQGRVSSRSDHQSEMFQHHMLAQEGVEEDEHGVISLKQYRWWPPHVLEESLRLKPETIDLFDKVELR